MVRPSGSSARPVCCSTVTPGKFATFWRSPVRRLKRVVLPEFGGPMTATVLTAPAFGNSRTAADPHPWQLLHSLILLPRFTRFEMHPQQLRRFAPQRDFRAVHLEDPRIAARSAP